MKSGSFLSISEFNSHFQGGENRKRTCEANAAGENSSFIFAVCVKSVPLYRFKLAYVVLHMAVKEFFDHHL